MADQNIQSLDRGLAVLRLLSRTPVMTATAISAELGIHQSSASRLLGSLLKAGFVRKPDFRSFALDYGALVFAGHALNCFPEIRACTAACNHIRSAYGFQAAVGILREGRVLYLTQTSSDAAISILDGSDFPLHRSTLGLILACQQDEDEAVNLIVRSLLRVYEAKWRQEGRERCEDDAKETAREIYAEVMENIRFHDFYYQTGSDQNRVNGAQTFALLKEQAAVAVYDPHKTADVGHMRGMLKDAIACVARCLAEPTVRKD